MDYLVLCKLVFKIKYVYIGWLYITKCKQVHVATKLEIAIVISNARTITGFFIKKLAFDFCRFCVVIRFFHPRHNGQ